MRVSVSFTNARFAFSRNGGGLANDPQSHPIDDQWCWWVRLVRLKLLVPMLLLVGDITVSLNQQIGLMTFLLQVLLLMLPKIMPCLGRPVEWST